MTGAGKKITDFLKKGLWEIDVVSLGRFKAFLVRSLRLLNVAVHEFTEGQLTLRAMGLVYTTLLSIVPVLAISFSVLKAFGIHNEIVEPFLLKFLAPLGSKGQEITSRIIDFVENMKVGVLGSLGFGMLVYTLISVIQKVEASFNAIWRIKKARSVARKFTDYISVILIGPVLIFSAIGITASFMSTSLIQKIVSIEPFGSLVYFIAQKSPYIIVCGAFTFLYIFIPNTKVRFRSALTGGIFAGILWETAGWAFASFIVSSTRYAVIYSGFAILILFMFWLYLSWLILLAGAQISFFHQYPYYLTAPKEVFSLSNRLRERLALLIMYFIGHSYYHGKQPWTINSLVTRLRLPLDPVDDMLALLEQNGLILETADDPPAYLPARDIEKITLNELVNSVRTAGETLSTRERVVSIPEVDAVMKSIDDACAHKLGSRTLKDLVLWADQH